MTAARLRLIRQPGCVETPLGASRKRRLQLSDISQASADSSRRIVERASAEQA